MLQLTLRFYATGNFLITCGDFIGVSPPTASRVVKKVSFAIAELAAEFIKMPSSDEELKRAADKLHQFAKFPKAIGCIDCTHVKIQSPGGNSAEVYRNRKGFFSINVQAVCNGNLEFTDLVARWPGSAHDSNIFQNSRLRARFENQDFGRYFLLGDSGYMLNSYMMTPITNPSTRSENLYNESQIRTRNCIERCFGVWKRRFPILSFGMRVQEQTVLSIIVACGVLHNIARKHKEPDPPQEDLTSNITLEQGDMQEIEESQPSSLGNNGRRNALVNYYFGRL